MGGDCTSRVSYQMILQISAHSRKIDKSGDAMLLELTLGSNSTAVQDIRAAVRSTGDNDLLLGLHLDHSTV